MSNSLIIERLCSRCGKNFIVAPEHMYRDEKKPSLIYCSYTCWIHSDDDKPKKKKGTVPKMVEQYSMAGELIRVYQSSNQAADYIGCCTGKLQAACRKGNIFMGYKWRYVKS